MILRKHGSHRRNYQHHIMKDQALQESPTKNYQKENVKMDS